MFLDASAMIAMVAAEEDASSIAARLAQAGDVQTSALAVWEAAVALARIGRVVVG